MSETTKRACAPITDPLRRAQCLAAGFRCEQNEQWPASVDIGAEQVSAADEGECIEKSAALFGAPAPATAAPATPATPATTERSSYAPAPPRAELPKANFALPVGVAPSPSPQPQAPAPAPTPPPPARTPARPPLTAAPTPAPTPAPQTQPAPAASAPAPQAMQPAQPQAALPVGVAPNPAPQPRTPANLLPQSAPVTPLAGQVVRPFTARLVPDGRTMNAKRTVLIGDGRGVKVEVEYSVTRTETAGKFRMTYRLATNGDAFSGYQTLEFTAPGGRTNLGFVISTSEADGDGVVWIGISQLG